MEHVPLQLLHRNKKGTVAWHLAAQGLPPRGCSRDQRWLGFGWPRSRNVANSLAWTIWPATEPKHYRSGSGVGQRTDAKSELCKLSDNGIVPCFGRRISGAARASRP